jgi:hypothetical protein
VSVLPGGDPRRQLTRHANNAATTNDESAADRWSHFCRYEVLLLFFTTVGLVHSLDTLVVVWREPSNVARSVFSRQCRSVQDGALIIIYCCDAVTAVPFSGKAATTSTARTKNASGISQLDCAGLDIWSVNCDNES